MTGRTVSAAVCAALLLAACSSATAGNGGRVDQRMAGTNTASRRPTTLPSAAAQSRAASTAEPRAAIDPCALLTKAEVDHAAGTKTGPAVRARDTCTYPTPTTAKFGQLNVYVGLGAKKIYDIDRKVLKHHFVTVPGIGDEAHLEEGEIFFRVESTWIAVQLARLDNVAKGPLLKAIARAAAGRL